jgi:hypothetical protein
MNTVTIYLHYASGKEQKVFSAANLAEAKQILRHQYKLNRTYTTGYYENKKGFTRLLEA